MRLFTHFVSTFFLFLSGIIFSFAQNISGGGMHTLLLCADSTIKAFGENYQNQLADSNLSYSNAPLNVSGLNGIIAVSGGNQFSLALKSDGTVWAWGENTYGQLGDGTTSNKIAPTLVTGLTNIVAISAGMKHALALDNNGDIWAWGDNSYGQLGNNSTIGSLLPIQIPGLSGVAAISAGNFHSLALQGGNVLAWGANSAGQLGNGSLANDSVPGTVTGGLSNIIFIDAGGIHSLALKNDGTVWAWGDNNEGQLGDGTTTNNSLPVLVNSLSNIIAIGAGGDHSLALKNDSTVWMWGYDMNPPQRQMNPSVNGYVTPVQINGLSGISKISCGSYHNLFYRNDGVFLGYGQNNSGQLGYGTNQFNYLYPVKVLCPCGTPSTPTVAAGPDITICPNADAMISAIGSGIAPFVYQWSPGNYLSNPDTSSPTVNIPFSGGNYSYGVIVRDNFMCPSLADSLVITMHISPPSPYINAAPYPTVCNGNSVTLNATGGANPQNYTWLPGGNTTISIVVTPTTNTTYTLVSTDTLGCTSTTTQTIDFVIPNIAPYNVSCGGPCNGYAMAYSYGGMSPYTYAWSTAETTSAVYSLCSGNYSLTVTDVNGCAATDSFNIVDPGPLALAPITVTNVSCNGTADGKLVFTASGGTVPYTYYVQPLNFNTSDTVAYLSPGGYTVTVTDAGGCSASVTDSAIITEPALLTANFSSTTNVSCNGGNDGNASVVASGGTIPYLYSWMPSGQTMQTATGLSAAVYTVTITDSNGCSTVAVDTISEPLLLISSISSANNAICNGDANGDATISASGGTGSYTYLWNPSVQTTSTATGLAAGLHTATVTDVNGCISTATATITEPALIVAALSSQINVSCNGGSDGIINTITTGGSGPLSFAWSTVPVQTSSTVSGLVAGTYTITATDSAGCSASAAFTITEPAILTVTLSTTNTSCNNTGTGTATASPAGGTLPYTYLWNPSMQNTQTATGLFIGNYTVAVVDSNGCVTGDTISVNGPLSIPITTTATPTSCGAQNGTATANISGPGAVPPFYVLWNTGDTGLTVSGLDAGIYRANVTDGNGCFSFSDALVTSSNGPVVTTSSVTNISCFGGNDGSINISITGGTPPYTFAWSNGLTTEDASNLVYGPYEVSVYDASGCVVVKSIFVNEPTPLSLTSSSISSSCTGTNGSATITIAGGTSPFTYLWSSGGTASTENGLGAGSFGIAVTDANGCTLSDMIAVSDSGGPIVLIDTIAAVYCGSSGFVLIDPLDSASIQSYQWSTGDTTKDLLNVSPGKYGLVITDTSGCKSSLVLGVTPVLPPLKPICVVTVDTLTNMNIVAWEKPVSTVIAGFNIYRESSQNQIYQFVAYSPYNNLSAYYDSIADPDARWAKYRISMVDVCGKEGPLSSEHKTIHLAIQSYSAQSIDLIWDAYVGYPFSYYHIFRKDSSNGIWMLLDSVPSTQNTYSDTALISNGDTLSYHIDVAHPNGCVATIKNPEPMASNLNSSRSNVYRVVDSSLVAVNNEEINFSIVLYPNPSSGVFTLKTSEKEIKYIKITNQLGEDIKFIQLKNNKLVEIIIDLRSFAKGIYNVQAVSQKKIVNKKIIIR